jgi:hypothetical protein
MPAHGGGSEMRERPSKFVRAIGEIDPMRIRVALVGIAVMALPVAVWGQIKTNPQGMAPVVQGHSSRIRGINTNSKSLTVQDQEPQSSPADRQGGNNQEPSGSQDVPAPPVNGQQPPVGPPLQVQSNAATMPDEYYQRASWCQIGDPIRVFGKTPGGFEIGGWFQSGYHSDSDGLFNNYDDGYRLHQAWMYAERKAPRCCNLSAGFRFDAVYGIDAQDMQAFGNPPAGSPDGWDNDWDHGTYGWAIPQLYGEIARDNVSIIGGKFINPMGYESVMSPKNFFYSRSFGFTNILPRTFTGLLTGIDLSRDTTVYTGVTTNWDTGFDRFNDSLNYLGGFAYKPCGPVQVSGFFSAGDTGYREDGYTQDLFVDVMLTEKLNYIVDWSFENSDTSHQFSIGNYLIYRINDCLGLGSRFEWFKSDIYTGSSDSTYSWTSGINFRRHANIVVRPELRVDWGEGAVDEGQPIFASDLIVTF